MNPARMHETWGTIASRLYDRVVSAGQEELYAELLARVVPAGLSGAALDVGSGPGHAAALLAARREVTVVGLDSAPEMVRLGAARGARDRRANLAFVRGDAQALPFPDRRFDFVYSIASLKHWPRPAAALAEIHRVLVPGGRMAVIEADRGARAEVVTAYARRFPWLPAAFGAAYFRVFVGGQSLDAFEAERLLAASPFGRDGGAVERFADMPLFVMRAEKA